MQSLGNRLFDHSISHVCQQPSRQIPRCDCLLARLKLRFCLPCIAPSVCRQRELPKSPSHRLSPSQKIVPDPEYHQVVLESPKK